MNEVPVPGGSRVFAPSPAEQATGQRRYATAHAMRCALEARLQAASQRNGAGLQCLRRRVAFDHFLAHLARLAAGRWVLKGGYAMELRFERARSTRDLDIAFETKDLEQVSGMLRAAGVLNPEDSFEFRVGGATMQLLYGGARFPVEARMAGRTFLTFHLDAAAGGLFPSRPETRILPGWLAFAGVRPVPVDLMPREQQFAEKAHAYSLPGSTPTAVSVIDLYLLASSQSLEPEATREAIARLFDSRATHEIPRQLMHSPEDCHDVYRRLSERIGLPQGPREAFQVVRDFWVNLLA